jgi:hypothetical protein
MIGRKFKDGAKQLYVGIEIPDDAFYSLCEAFTSGHIKEFSLRLSKFEWSRGVIDAFCCSGTFTDVADLPSALRKAQGQIESRIGMQN